MSDPLAKSVFLNAPAHARDMTQIYKYSIDVRLRHLLSKGIGDHHLRERVTTPNAAASSANAPDRTVYRVDAAELILPELVAPRTSRMPEWP